MINCAIIDDEPLAREGIANYINEIGFLKLVDTFGNPVEFVKLAEQHHVELIFLDIHMPKINGIEFLKMAQNPPMVIIITAFPDYALEGFQLNVLDYLLKPVTFDRFFKSATKAKNYYNLITKPTKSEAQKIDEVADYFFIKCGSKYEKIFFDDILYVEPDSQYVLNADINGSNSWRNLITSAYAEKKIREGEMVNFNADYLLYKNNNPTFAYSSFVDKNGNPPISNDTLFSPFQRASSSSTIQVGVVKLDYIRQLNPKLKLETGFKGNFTRNVSLSGIESLVNGAWVSRPTTTNNVLMKESIGASYASLYVQLNPFMNLIASARYEYSYTQMDDRQRKQRISERKLGKLFPGIFFSLKLKDQSALQLSYTKRISRPTYNDLASFVVYTDPTSVEMGNPLLKPTITNNLRLRYSIHRYSFSLLLSRDDYPIARHQIVSNQAGDLLVLSPQNLICQNNLTIQANLPWKVNNWWSMSYSFAGSWRKFKLDYTAKLAEMSYFSYSVNFNESFKLPRSFFLEVSGWYNSLTYNGSKKVNGYGAVNGGIKKELNKDLGSLQLAVIDIFKTMRITSYFGSVTEEAFNLKSRVPFSTETTRSPIIKLTYSRSFGNGKLKSQRMQGDGLQEERERIRN